MPGQYPYFDDTEGPVLQEFMNDDIARDHDTPSPRSELLSPSSDHGNGQYGITGAMERRRRHRGPPERYRRERERVHSNTPSRDLLHLLVDQEYEATKMRKALYASFRRLEEEGQRVSEAERVTRETTQHFRTLNERRVSAQQEANQANEELRMYKLQLDTAQGEILRAQEVLGAVERQRNDAEEAAARARTMARRLNQEKLVAAAREEGRRLGFEAGFRRAQTEQQELRPQQRSERTRTGRDEEQGDARVDMIEGENQAFERQDDRDYRDEGVETNNFDDGDRNQRDAQSASSSPSMLPLRVLGSPEVVRLSEPLPQPIMEHSREPVPIAEPVLISEQPPITHPITEQYPITEPVPMTEPVTDFRSETPSIQIYPIDIPPADEVERDYNTNPPTSKYAGQYQPYQPYQPQPLEPQPWPDQADARQSLRPVPSSSRNNIPRPPDNYRPPSSWDGQSADGPESEFSQPPPSSHSPNSVTLPPILVESDDGSLTGGIGHSKRKQSWYRRDRDRGMDLDEQPAQPQPPAQTQSWYRPKGWTLPKGSSSVRTRARDFSFNKPARRFSNESGSASTRISQLDIVTTPTPLRSGKGKDRGFRSLKEKERGLSVINEDVSRQTSPLLDRTGRSRSRAGSSSTLGTDLPPQVPPKDFGVGRHAFRTQKERGESLSGESDRRRGLDLGPRMFGQGETERETEQRMADQPRNSDSHDGDFGRMHGAMMPAHSVAPAANLWAPAQPPSPPDEWGFVAPALTRSMSGATGTSSRSQAGLTANRPSLRRVRRGGINLSEMSPPGISIEPPSRSPSDTPGVSATLPPTDLYLSPNQASQPLPHPRPHSPVPAVPNTPTMPTAPLIFPQNGQLPPGFVPQSTIEDQHSGQAPIRIPFPSSPGSTTHGADPLLVPIPPSTAPSVHDLQGGPPSRPKSAMSDRPPQPTGPAAQGLSYPYGNPPVPTPNRAAAQPLPPSRPGSILSNVPRRISRNGGMTPGDTNRTLPGPGEHSLNRVPSNTSLASGQTGKSYAHYDPSTYLDPAYYSTDTGVNSQANATRPGGPGTRSRNVSNSSSLSYMTDPTMAQS